MRIDAVALWTIAVLTEVPSACERGKLAMAAASNFRLDPTGVMRRGMSLPAFSVGYSRFLDLPLRTGGASASLVPAA